MKELLEFILKTIVTNKEAVLVEEEKSEDFILIFNVKVDEKDKGIVIGRGGRTIKAIRQIVAILARKAGQKVIIKVED
jgi:predicted RNA-binding protein YlqC (UPF0109 family)